MQNIFDPSQLFSGKDFGFKQKPQELLWETEEASNENEFYFHRQCLFIELPKENVRLKQIAKTCEICQNSLSCEWGPSPYFELPFPCFNLVLANQQTDIKLSQGLSIFIFSVPKKNSFSRTGLLFHHIFIIREPLVGLFSLP